MFTVELAGFGVVKDPGFPPYPIFIVSVQQPMQSWTCYRRYSSFKSLSEHLPVAVGAKGAHDLPPCPVMSDEMLMGGGNEQLNRARILLHQWLHQALLYPGVKESQVLRNFLCANANMPPPRLDITWANSYCPSLDEMEMDELFDRHLEELEEGDRDGLSDDERQYIGGYGSDTQGAGMNVGMSYASSRGAGGMSVNPGAQGGADFGGSGLDLPSQDDIASSVPVEITFRDPSSMAATPANDNGGAVSAAAPPTGGAGGKLGSEQQRGFPPSKVGLDNFKIIRVIGKGSFGKVFLVRDKKEGKIYAMKVLRKNNIIKRNQVEHTKTERNVLGYVKHPFIVGLNMAFQTPEKLFFVLDYCAGGELFFHLGKLGKFAEPRACFYTAEIALALQYIHQLEIVYRDLKPENVLLDGEGHIRLTDFGLSKEGISNTTSGAHSFCGTPEYLAPEILTRQGHGRAVDWWSLGALLYEMLTGLPPFYCRDREKLFEKIKRGELTYPRGLSEPARDILGGLLTRNPAKRLGSGPDDAEEVKRHRFFSDLDWDVVLQRNIKSPWQPTMVGSLDTSQFDHEFTSMPIFSPSDRNDQLRPGHVVDNSFEGFTFVDTSSRRIMEEEIHQGSEL